MAEQCEVKVLSRVSGSSRACGRPATWRIESPFVKGRRVCGIHARRWPEWALKELAAAERAGSDRGDAP